MKRAFFFDMDGVMLDSEKKWEKHGTDFPKELYGEEIAKALGNTAGMSLDHEYAFAKARGFSMPLQEYYRRYDEQAEKMYALSEISPGLEELVQNLKSMGFAVGIVSSARRYWIDLVMQKLSRPDLFDYIISLNQEGLPSKPNPAGYRRAMKDLGVKPKNTIVLEDSNGGIKAARRSRAFVISYTENLSDGYVVKEKAHATARSMPEVLRIVRRRISR